ncbi:MAG: hypothetical protein CV088_00435 [Nitrospira sp. LK70]|nr:hypothetical protein [Nitrospira sp. LK70]
MLVAFVEVLFGTGLGHAAVPITLENDAIELTLIVETGPHGRVVLTGIRDKVAGQEWLSSLSHASPLFELSFGGTIFRSDNLPVALVKATGMSLNVKGELFGLPNPSRGHAYEIEVILHPGESVARVSGAFKNNNDDWFGPFLLGDHGKLPIPVFAPDANLASVRVNEQSEAVFVVGFDGVVYGAGEQHNGAWGTPWPLYTTTDPNNLFPAGAPITAVRRNDRQLDVFSVAVRGDIRTVFQRASNYFSSPISLTAERFLEPGAPLAALNVHEETDPAVNRLEVYAVQDSTGQLFVIGEDNDGQWSAPQLVTMATPRLGRQVHIAALQRNTRQRDLFLIDASGNLLTTFCVQGGAWSPFMNLSANKPGLLPPSGRLAAVNGKGNDEHVFAMGNDHRLYWTHEEKDGAWGPLQAITEPLDAVPGAGITAVHRTAREIAVAVPQRNGAIAVVSKTHDALSWSTPSELVPAEKIGANANLTATLRNPGQLDLFYVSTSDRRLWTTAAGIGDLVLRTVFPKISFTGPSELAGALGMVAQEVGAVTPLEACPPCRTLGMPYVSDRTAQLTGLPQGMNSLEVASVTRGRSTLFFVDLSGNLEAGRAPIQMTLSSIELAGFWEARIHGGHKINLPEFAIGVAPDDSWREAVNYYVNHHRSEWRFPDTPAWLREAGAIYTFAGGGAGGIYLEPKLNIGAPSNSEQPRHVHPSCPGPSNILVGNLGDYATWFGPQNTFQYLLPYMLAEARGLGTDVVYLWDYWDFTGTCAEDLHDHAPYFCKGDYRVRCDLGGVGSLRAGIEAVHASHGRVILYVEPFVIGTGSDVFNQYRYLWGARQEEGGNDEWDAFKDGNTLPMSQARYWQDRVVEIATRLVKDTGADGIFLDSGGWRMNLRLNTWQEVVGHSALEHAEGFLELADRVRREIRKFNAEAVVLTETAAGPIGRHVDGGVSADFHDATDTFTGAETLGGRLIASPVRFGVPQINFFSNGQNLSQMNQMFASGQSLALAGNWLPAIPSNFKNFMRNSANYIKRLVTARRTFADALVSGTQIDQPTTEAGVEGARHIVAYGYSGGQHDVITVVNVEDEGAALIGLKQSSVLHAGDVFCDAVSNEQFVASDLPLLVAVPPASDPCAHDDGSHPVCGLRVLVKKYPTEVRGVLLVGKFRSQQHLNGMSSEDQRNTLITELAARTKDTVAQYQALNDAALASAGALLVYLRETGSRTDQQIKAMTADDMRNTVIVEVGIQTGHGSSELQALSNMELIHLVLEPHSYIRGILLVGKFRSQQHLNGMSSEDQRNTLITELAARTKDTVVQYQALNDAALAGAGALLVYLRETGSRTDQQIKAMTADDMRNTVIVEVGIQTGRGSSELQALSNTTLMEWVLKKPIHFWYGC